MSQREGWSGKPPARNLAVALKGSRSCRAWPWCLVSWKLTGDRTLDLSGDEKASSILGSSNQSALGWDRGRRRQHLADGLALTNHG